MSLRISVSVRAGRFCSSVCAAALSAWAVFIAVTRTWGVYSCFDGGEMAFEFGVGIGDTAAQ
ncbi:hypothetical protein [Nocardia bhagyanarayanae]|uniref:Uncharacterized protein n=1 Tax=Nocardia bhagyanarayanae TaxID=1215925 RepID=A0A543FGH8_9NOCA|nr:hypothetical protein [Nocardia bhagyanarayanae]TQM32967.1 hypothetical protein FB390_4678 [Nocardia bhagyanarayanae]